MGLSVSVGVLADCLRELDPSDVDDDATEKIARLRTALATVNSVLAAQGLPPFTEPESPVEKVSPGGGFPYSFLHYLRRAYAYVIEKEPLVPVREQEGISEWDNNLIRSYAVAGCKM